MPRQVLTIATEPTIEPVTLLEVKNYMRIDSNDFADDLTSAQSIAPGAHVVAATYSLVGTGVDVLGYNALVEFSAGTNGTSGTVDVKIQESDVLATGYTDVASGAFTQVTEANDNATYEKSYTGIKQYIRVVATVGTATCSFGVSIITDAPTVADDDLITGMAVAARKYLEESYLHRALITQTWDYYLDRFPATNFIEIPRPPLISVSQVEYIDSDDTTNTLSPDDYDVDTDSEPGRIVLGYGNSWPSFTPRPMNPIVIRFVAGYGATAATVPQDMRNAIKYYTAGMYEMREPFVTGTIVKKLEWIENMIMGRRIWSI